MKRIWDGDIMKKILTIIIALTILSSSGCSAPNDEVLTSLGEYKTKEYFTSGGFQDYTDYAKYTYEKIEFSDNKYFKQISTDSEKDLKAHIENFEECIESIKNSDSKNELVLGYDFDASVISDDDYLHIYDDPDYPELGNYDIYYYDIENMTLYYFHNNI